MLKDLVDSVLPEMGQPRLTEVASVLVDLPVAPLMRRDRIKVDNQTATGWDSCRWKYAIRREDVVGRTPRDIVDSIDHARKDALAALVKDVNVAFLDAVRDGNADEWVMTIRGRTWLNEAGVMVPDGSAYEVTMSCEFRFTRRAADAGEIPSPTQMGVRG